MLLFRSSCMCKRCRCNHKLNKCQKDISSVCECIGIIYTYMNSWKEPFTTYNSSKWIFSLFWLLNCFQACFQSDTIVVSRQQLLPYCLCWLYKEKFIELWTNQKQTGDSALVQSKGTKTIYINSVRIIHIWSLGNKHIIFK